MSTPIPVNERAVHFVGEAAQEINTRDGLEALLLVLEKMHGNAGLITNSTTLGVLYGQIKRKIAGLASPPPKPPAKASP